MKLGLQPIRRLFVISLVASMAIFSREAASESLTLTAGSPGGGYFKAAAAFAEYIKESVPGIETTVIPGGGWANVERLQASSRLADVAVLENALASMAFNGKGPKSTKYDFRMIAAIRGPSVAQAVTPVNTRISSFEQIAKDKIPVRIATFERSQLATAQALAILQQYGLSKEKIDSFGGKVMFTSHKEGIRMLMDGQADMWFTGGSMYPHHQYIKVGSKMPFTLLPISKKAAMAAGSEFGQSAISVPKDIYGDNNGKNDAYWSPATVVTFGVRTTMADDLVYKITKALAKNKSKFHKVHKQHKFYEPATAWKNVGGVPVHPGAERYYKEMGYMK
ncbi:MAG: hypothetical protein CBB68_02870 [Rhodospirillaceae bacterium TMED8]|nr:hypothetical protein [Magnetovibrio sp.]OUT52312.1 MAG: hypothetical protein CBB68_02870 [Rhodospirillaceae bacterium TMED8]